VPPPGGWRPGTTARGLRRELQRGSFYPGPVACEHDDGRAPASCQDGLEAHHARGGPSDRASVHLDVLERRGRQAQLPRDGERRVDDERARTGIPLDRQVPVGGDATAGRIRAESIEDRGDPSGDGRSVEPLCLHRRPVVDLETDFDVPAAALAALEATSVDRRRDPEPDRERRRRGTPKCRVRRQDAPRADEPLPDDPAGATSGHRVAARRREGVHERRRYDERVVTRSHEHETLADADRLRRPGVVDDHRHELAPRDP
jgi:hypothetical protein